MKQTPGTWRWHDDRRVNQHGRSSFNALQNSILFERVAGTGKSAQELICAGPVNNMALATCALSAAQF